MFVICEHSVRIDWKEHITHPLNACNVCGSLKKYYK